MASICFSPPDRVPASWRWRSLSRGKSVKATSVQPVERRAAGRGHGEVVGHAQVREHRPALADVADAHAGQHVGADVVQVATVDVAAAAGGGEQAAHDPEHGRLAGAVRAEQRGDARDVTAMSTPWTTSIRP